MSAPSAAALFLLGANHHQAPIELRERLALSGDKVERFQAQLRELPGLQEHLVLNTCNRIEFYGCADPETIALIQQRFCAFQGFSEAEFASIRLQAHGQAVLEHLISVSAGLESQMLGETEILGQVKTAYASAQLQHSVGPVLNRVFQKSFQYAKYIRSHTAITEGQISVANVAVDLATKIFGRLDEARILLLGAGDIGEKTAKAFLSRGARTLTVSSRRFEHAAEVAGSLGAAALPFEQWPIRLPEFDIVVCSTAAPQTVVTARVVSESMRHRPARPLFFIDLALPRDVDLAAAECANVFLYNLDDLARIAEENLAARTTEVKKAREILAEKAAYLWGQLAKNGQ